MTTETPATPPESEAEPAAPDFSQVRAIAFDCYGTLVDFGDHHFIDLMGVVCARNQFSIEGKSLWNHWLAMSKEVWRDRGRDPENPTAGPEPRFGTYADLWTEQFQRAFHALEVEGDARAAYELLIERARVALPYAETHEVINALRSRYEVCVLSNADDDWLHSCLRTGGLSFERIVSSESAQSYKPRAKIFLDTAQMLGVAPPELLYVGDSPIADVLGARNAGLPVAWVNRYAAKLPDAVPQPDLEITDLRGLLVHLAADGA
jgi:2-haloalkanoic acid dehalogenase type II